MKISVGEEGDVTKTSSPPHELNNKWWVNGIPTCRDRDTDKFHHENLKINENNA